MLKQKLIKEIERAIANYQYLNLIKENNRLKVFGEIELFHPQKGKFDEYSLSILFPDQYPYCFPKVYEVSEKIPKKDYRHVNPDGSLCIAVEPEENAITRNGLSFSMFLEQILIPHLSRETYREIEGKYEDGEFPHGNKGIWEFYKLELSVTTKQEVLSELERIVKIKWPKRNLPCFCGSGRKFKGCHSLKWKKVMNSGRPYLMTTLQKMKENILI